MSPATPALRLRRRLLAATCALVFAAAVPAAFAGPPQDVFTDLRGVNERSAAASLEPPAACESGTCPLLGRGVYLADYAVNAAIPVGTGPKIFRDTAIGKCARLRPQSIGSRNFLYYESNESFVNSMTTETGVSGSASTLSLAFRTTLSSTTGYVRGSKSQHRSTALNVTVAHLSVDFVPDDDCAAASNLNPALVADFRGLPKIEDATSPAEWLPYTRFLKKWGSHVLVQEVYGSRFQQWESVDAAQMVSMDTLEAKACLGVEGQTLTGWSVQSCAGFSEETVKKARSTTTKSRRNVLGGSEAARLALLESLDRETLHAFIESATEASESVMHFWQPLASVLHSAYSVPCEGAGCDRLGDLQRAVNLQAAYEGWLAVGCTTMEARGKKIQEMRVTNTSEFGLSTYGCWARKLGCMHDDDCHGSGTACYCYGASCIAKDESQPIGDPSDPTDWRNSIQGNEDPLGTNEGVNRSCYVDGLFTCGCHYDWVGELDNRYLWLQGVE